MKISYHPRAPTPEHVDDVWYHESEPKLTWELPGPRIVALEHVEQSREQDAPAGAGAHHRGGGAMERVIERCGGLDVHKKTVVACVRVPGRTSGREQHVRTFGTTTAELLALRDWLGGYGVTHVAMESTGVYWKPIFYVARGRVHVCAGQRRAGRAGAGAEDGRQGLRLDRPTTGARARAGKLCAASADPRTPRSHALSRRADRRAHP